MKICLRISSVIGSVLCYLISNAAVVSATLLPHTTSNAAPSTLARKVEYAKPDEATDSDQFLIAIFDGDIATVKNLLHGGFDPNTLLTADKIPALIIATSRGNHAVMRLLVAHGADLEFRYQGQATSLVLSVVNNDFEAVSLLVANGANVNVVGPKGWSPLQEAAFAGYAHIAQVLIAAGADVNYLDGSIGSALSAAAWRGHSDVVDLLLQHGADIEAVDEMGRTPLVLASIKGYHMVVATLLDMGAEINARMHGGDTALSLAVMHNSMATVKQLVEKGADVNAVNDNGSTPLLLVAGLGDAVQEIEELFRLADKDNIVVPLRYSFANARYLIDHGAEIHVCNHDGDNALMLAAYNGHIELMHLLIGKGIDINAKNNRGLTALIKAILHNQKAAVRLLLVSGANGKDEAKSYARLVGSDREMMDLLN